MPPVLLSSVVPAWAIRGISVAPRGRRGQRAAVSFRCHRTPAGDAGHPQGMPLRSFPVGGRVSGPRVGRAGGFATRLYRVEDSTDVRAFQDRWRICQSGADWWGEMTQAWGRGWACAGQGRVRAMARAERESDGFFGVLGANGAGCGRGWATGVCAGASEGHWLRAYQTTKSSPPS